MIVQCDKLGNQQHQDNSNGNAPYWLIDYPIFLIDWLKQREAWRDERKRKWSF